MQVPAFFLAGMLLAPEQVLQLREALDRAVLANPDVAREVASIDTAEGAALRTLSPFDFVVTGDLTYGRTFRLIPGLPTTNPIDSLSYSISLGRGLETGVGSQLSLQFQGVRSDLTGTFCATMANPALTDCTNYQNSLQLNLVHPLLRGFGLATTARARDAAQARVTAAQANRVSRVAGLVRDVVLAYWELAYAVEDVIIRKEALKLAHDQLALTQAQVTVGRLSQVEEFAVRATIAQRDEEVAIAELLVRQRSRELRRLLGQQPDPKLPAFRTTAAPSVTPRQLDAAQVAEQAVADNPAMAAIREGARAAELDREAAENLLLPDLTFVGSLGTAGVASSTTPPENTFGSTIRQWGDFDMQYSAGLRLTWQIGNRDARGQMKTAEAQKRRADVDLAALETETKLSAVRFADEMTTAARRVELSRAAVEFAEKNVLAERAKFEVGRTTNYEVLRRQQELSAAQVRRLRAAIDYLAAEAALLGLSGRILETYGVKLKEK